MKNLKFLIVGFGSIGKRHYDNLVNLSYEVYVFSYRRNKNPNYVNEEIKFVDNLEKAIDKVDAVIICNSTEKHIEVALQAATKGKHIFVEKPLSHNLNNLKKLKKVLKSNKIIFASGFMLRKHPNLIFIKDFIRKKELGKIYYANASIGQDLRQWRKNYDYTKGYAANSATGGGVTLDLIHEIDLINWLIGEADIIIALLGFNNELKIKTESISNISIKTYENILCNIQLDYLCPILKRKLEIVGEKGIINWDFKKNNVCFTNRDDHTKELHKLDKNFERNLMYLDEIKDFIEKIKSNDFDLSHFDYACNALKVAIGAKLSYKNASLIYNKDIKLN